MICLTYSHHGRLFRFLVMLPLKNASLRPNVVFTSRTVFIVNSLLIRVCPNLYKSLLSPNLFTPPRAIPVCKSSKLMPMSWVQLAIICTLLPGLGHQPVVPHQRWAQHQGKVLAVCNGLERGSDQLSCFFINEIVLFFCCFQGM